MTHDHPRALLNARGLRPKKRLGQHFLTDEAVAQKIARLALEGASSDAPFPIVEIGAGTGTLTRALVENGADVTAIEIDPALIAILRSRDDLRPARIVEADALSVDYARFARGREWHATGNLPYYVGTPLLLRLVEMHGGPTAIVAMIQKDVADRLVAKPGTPAYGSLSVAVQYAMHVERALTLAPRAFYPAPKVESTVVRLTRRETPAVTPRDEAFFRQVVRASFAYRRKTLANSLALALGLDRADVAHALTNCGFAPEIRGEQLDLDAFARLADELAPGGI